MPKMIKLHHHITGKSIWLNPDAIISVIDNVATVGTTVYTYAGNPSRYQVAETPETVVGMIEQACNPLDSYMCVAPESINWAKEEEK